MEFWYRVKRTADKDGDYALIGAKFGRLERVFLAIIAPSRSVHMVAAQVSRRGGRRTHSPTPLPQRAYALNVRVPPSATKRLFMDVIAESIEEPHASFRTLLYHMYARADEECSFFFPYHVFCLTLTPSYFARSRLVVAAADNATARMADSQLMCNPSCWRSLRFFSFHARDQLWRVERYRGCLVANFTITIAIKRGSVWQLCIAFLTIFCI